MLNNDKKYRIHLVIVTIISMYKPNINPPCYVNPNIKSYEVRD